MMNNHDDDRTHSHIVLTGGTMVGHCRIVKKIGAGGMGEVYLADDTKLERKVALKFLSPNLCQDTDCRSRFTREAQAAAKLDHPNIVTVYEVGEHQGRPFFAMAHVEGQSLKEYAAGRELSIDQVSELGIQICEGLQAAHDKGITHRDIKPSNILIDSHGRARIVDFGLASVVGKDQLTKTGSTLGTIGYMSPEQVQGEGVDHRSDLFSLGVVLYELIAKQNPFKRDSEAATLKAVIDHVPEPLARFKRDVPELLGSIVTKMLEKNPAHRYQSAAGVISDLKRLMPVSGSTISSHAVKKSWIPMRIALPAVVVLLVVAVLVLKPWKLEIWPEQQAVAAENRLAIMYFDNLTDPTDSLRLGEIIMNLLITDLSESKYVQVVSSQRLYDILKQLGHEGEKRIGREVATQIAQKAGARWMLMGSILSTEPEIIVAAQLVDVTSGDALASQRVEGTPGDRIFSVIDQLTVEVKGDLSLPPEATAEKDQSVAVMSTDSPEALRLYLEGRELVARHHWSEADKLFAKALEFDSTYAMPHYYRAVMAYYRGDYPVARAHIEKAMGYSEHIGDKARHYIRSLDARLDRDFARATEELEYIIEHYPDEKGAYLAMGLLQKYDTGEIEKAVECFKKVVELDPYQREGLNQLAYGYNELGQFEKSIWAINKYIEIAPDEANPYDSKGEILALNGKLDEAIACYEKANTLKPGFGRFRLAELRLLRGEYTQAESLYMGAIVDGDREDRAYGRLGLARISLHQGKFRDAICKLDLGVETDRMESVDESIIAHKIWVLCYANARIGNTRRAFDDGTAEIALLERCHPGADALNIAWAYIAWHLAQINDRLAADNIINRLHGELQGSQQGDSAAYLLARAFVSQELGQYDTATAYWQVLHGKNPDTYLYQLNLGISLLGAGDLGEAVITLEKAMNSYSPSRAYWPPLSVEGHYWLGQAYEASGWTDKAIEQYETFLDIWKDADEGLKSIDDAKERLARLKTSI
jgi:serine/threonine protein kinase/tetratricopeptide (TPR) repeat protein